MPATDVFRSTGEPKELPKGGGYTLAQKMVGKACGKPLRDSTDKNTQVGVLPGDYCEPRMTTVGSQAKRSPHGGVGTGGVRCSAPPLAPACARTPRVR